MQVSPFVTDIAKMPSSIPLFPLTGALLLPGGRMPLNIFEPRYLNMVTDALGDGRLIGMIQPIQANPDDNTGRGDESDSAPKLYQTGCADRITAFSETDDSRFVITLLGACRFEVQEEIPTTRGYRRAQVSFEKFRGDPEIANGAACAGAIDRAGLMTGLRGFLSAKGISVDWDSIDEVPDEQLVTSLSMTCPFEPPEKQALLECPTLAERAETMIALLRMSAHDDGGGDEQKH